MLLMAAVCAGCDILRADSPTDWVQATPVQIAGNAKSVLFKSPGESNNCPLQGGIVSFRAEHDGTTGPVEFVYDSSSASPRNDVVRLTTEAGTLSVNGKQQFSLAPPSARVLWHELRRLDPSNEQLSDKNGARLSITSPTPGRYVIRATNRRHADLFTGIAMPIDGMIYLRNAVFTTVVASYSGKSQHDCGNWNTAATATAALQRIERSIPP